MTDIHVPLPSVNKQCNFVSKWYIQRPSLRRESGRVGGGHQLQGRLTESSAGLKAGKVTAVCGRGVAYRTHDWAESAAHWQLRAM